MTANTAKEKALDLTVRTPQEREKIAQRIMDLSAEQFERLLILCAQQDQEFFPACPDPRQTSA